MKCPDCGTLVVHTYDTKLDKSEGIQVNAQYRYNICENKHTFPTVEFIARRRTHNAETTKIELSRQYEQLIEFTD